MSFRERAYQHAAAAALARQAADKGEARDARTRAGVATALHGHWAGGQRNVMFGQAPGLAPADARAFPALTGGSFVPAALADRVIKARLQNLRALKSTIKPSVTAALTLASGGQDVLDKYDSALGDIADAIATGTVNSGLLSAARDALRILLSRGHLLQAEPLRYLAAETAALVRECDRAMAALAAGDQTKQSDLLNGVALSLRQSGIVLTELETLATRPAIERRVVLQQLRSTLARASRHHLVTTNDVARFLRMAAERARARAGGRGGGGGGGGSDAGSVEAVDGEDNDEDDAGSGDGEGDGDDGDGGGDGGGDEDDGDGGGDSDEDDGGSGDEPDADEVAAAGGAGAGAGAGAGMDAETRTRLLATIAAATREELVALCHQADYHPRVGTDIKTVRQSLRVKLGLPRGG